MIYKTFPVLMPSKKLAAELIALGCPTEVPWGAVARHEAQCISNHDQGVARLAARGGLDPSELVAVLENRRWRMMSSEEAVERLLVLLAKEGPG